MYFLFALSLTLFHLVSIKPINFYKSLSHHCLILTHRRNVKEDVKNNVQLNSKILNFKEFKLTCFRRFCVLLLENHESIY